MGRPSGYTWALVAGALATAASCVAPRRDDAEPPLRPDAFVGQASAREVDASPETEANLSSELVRAHNARRAKEGLPPLFENAMLDASAEAHARDMADRRKMSHRGGDGSSSFDRIKRQGYVYRSAGENVAYGFDDVESVMTAWMKSPGHRKNILGNYSQIGVGRAIAKDGASYWCVTFGTPMGH